MVLVLLCKRKREKNKKKSTHEYKNSSTFFEWSEKKHMESQTSFFTKENLFDFLVVFFRPLKMGRNFVYGFVLVFFVHGKSSTTNNHRTGL